MKVKSISSVGIGLNRKLYESDVVTGIEFPPAVIYMERYPYPVIENDANPMVLMSKYNCIGIG